MSEVSAMVQVAEFLALGVGVGFGLGLFACLMLVLFGHDAAASVGCDVRKGQVW